MRQFLAQGLSILKLVIIAMVVLGQDPFPHLNMETPSIFTWATQNKVRLSDIVNLYCPAEQTEKKSSLLMA